MELRRKSDGYLLCSEFTEWSGWRAIYPADVSYTIAGVPHRHREGVMLKGQTVRCAFSSGFPGATETRYWATIEADRSQRVCTFRDSRGVTRDVLILEKTPEEERMQDVRSEDIRYVTLLIVENRYYE